MVIVTRSNYASGSNSCRIPRERKERGAGTDANADVEAHACTHACTRHAHAHAQCRSDAPAPLGGLRPLFAHGLQGRAMCIVREHSLESNARVNTRGSRYISHILLPSLPLSRLVPSDSSTFSDMSIRCLDNPNANCERASRWRKMILLCCYDVVYL